MNGVSISSIVTSDGTPDLVYAQGSWNEGRSEGAFQSSDAGRTWSRVGTEIPGTTSRFGLAGAGNACIRGGFHAFAISRRAPKTMYAACFESYVREGFEPGGDVVGTLLSTAAAMEVESHVYRSSDGGQSWALAERGLRGFVQELAVDPQDPSTVFAGTRYGPTGWQAYQGARGLFRTRDGGRSWRKTGPSGSIEELAVDAREPTTVYVLADGLWKSSDTGGSWLRLDPGGRGLAVLALAVDPASARTLYAATWHPLSPFRAFLFKSTNAGNSWVENARATGTDRDRAPFTFDALAVDSAGRIYVGTAAGGFVCDSCRGIGSH